MAANLPAHITGISQIWLINLDRRRDRFERFMRRHPEMSGRINRLPAYDGKSLELTPALARLFQPNNFEWHKPTMGCAMSHLALWYRLASEADENASYLILEDDAVLEPSWVSKIEKAFYTGAVPADFGVLFLGGILPKYRDTFEKSVRPVNRMVGRVDPDYVFGSNPRGYFHFCAYAYLLNKRGAKRLLDLVEGGNGVWMQADFFVSYTTPELSPPRPVYFFHPLLAQSFQDCEQGYAKPYGDESDETVQVDSDIWKEGDKFSADEIGSCLRPDDPLDIPGALGLPAIARPARAENNSEVAPVDKASPVKKAGLICVTWNSAEKLKVTLESIAKHTDPATYDLYVVDNASTDDTAAICSGTWPANFKFIRSEKNLGWVGAINSRLPEMRGYAYVGFLNDDIEVGPRWLEFLVGILDRHKNVGAVGPLTSNDRDWQSYDRFRTGPSRPGLPELHGIRRDDVVAMSRAMASFNPGVTVNDCVLAFFCVLIRSELISKIGGLDDAFNDLYLGDDDDYCRRIVAAGYLLALSFNSYVAHHSGSRSLSVDDHERRYRRAQEIIAAKHGGPFGGREKESATRLASEGGHATGASVTAVSLAGETDGETVPQNLGHMVLEGHLGGFFSEGDGGTYYPVMWSHLVKKYGIRSVLDVGCGRGYSSLYFKSLGCSIKGIDGSKEAAETNLIGTDFVAADYTLGPAPIEGSFDLAWSCEFVEHVEEKFMANYLQDFCRAKFLAMTFAGPGQPGHHHVNCRPAEYWIRMLHAFGFDYLPEDTTEMREFARRDMEKNNSETDKRFVYHFIDRGLVFRRNDLFDSSAWPTGKPV